LGGLSKDSQATGEGVTDSRAPPAARANDVELRFGVPGDNPPPDKQEKATETVLEQAETLSSGWAA